ncbi:RICIN domain-containing protein [Streptomyces sp. NPDC059740]|uniref:RICIN domain-containing protein n=1 Tax=Streptomyces sp. NPDC059740 TaxID=3346926 RepID=UPI003666A1AA
MPLLLMASGGHQKAPDREIAVNDVQQPTAPGSPTPSLSASPKHSPSPSASAKHSSPKPTTRTGHPATHGASAPKHSSTKSKKSSGTLAAPAARMFGGAWQVLLHDRATNLCADLPDYGNGKINGPVSQFHCRAGDSDNQMWNLQPVDGKGPGQARLFVIRNAKDGLCMDLPAYGGHPAGTKITEFTCDGSARDNQSWYLAPGHDNHYQLRNTKSGGRCLGVAGGPGSGVDVQLALRPCGPADTDWSWSAS